MISLYKQLSESLFDIDDLGTSIESESDLREIIDFFNSRIDQPLPPTDFPLNIIQDNHTLIFILNKESPTILFDTDSIELIYAYNKKNNINKLIFQTEEYHILPILISFLFRRNNKATKDFFRGLDIETSDTRNAIIKLSYSSSDSLALDNTNIAARDIKIEISSGTKTYNIRNAKLVDCHDFTIEMDDMSAVPIEFVNLIKNSTINTTTIIYNTNDKNNPVWKLVRDKNVPQVQHIAPDDILDLTGIPGLELLGCRSYDLRTNRNKAHINIIKSPDGWVQSIRRR